MNRDDIVSHTLDRRHALLLMGAPLVAAALAGRAGAAQEATPPATEPVLPEDQLAPYPEFAEDASIRGTVRCVGSSAVGLVLNAARPGFRESQPDISIEVISSGSGAAPKALAAREADLAPMSRAMRQSEIDEIEKARGAPVRFVDIAIDAIAVSVNRANPMQRISLRDLDRIFGRERRRGGSPAVTWGDLGLRQEPWAKRQITLFGMGPGTGSNGIVQEIVLQGGAFRTAVNEEPVSSSVIQAVAADPSAIGYASAYFTAQRARQIELEAADGTGFVPPTADHIRSGRYPLARALRLYFVADRRTSPAAMQFLRFLVSQDGQELIGDLGQITLDAAAAHAEFAKTRF